MYYFLDQEVMKSILICVLAGLESDTIKPYRYFDRCSIRLPLIPLDTRIVMAKSISIPNLDH